MKRSPPRREIRIDLQMIADMIEPKSRVLDVGCGDGALLEYLDIFKQVDGRGIEIRQSGVNACVSRGLSVIQGDANLDLKDYPSDAFDYVILSQTLQATQDPRAVLEELLRIGRRAIVSLPNFGFWRVRAYLALRGRMPVTNALRYEWYNSPNIHLCTNADFVALCALLGLTIEQSVLLDGRGRVLRLAAGKFLGNLLGEQGVFLLSKR